MSAATLGRPLAAERAPLQPDLLADIDPAPVIDEARGALAGRLGRAAELRVSADGRHAHLIVQIVQPPHGGRSRLPVCAVYHAPESQVLELQALARRLPRGTPVLIVFRGIDLDAQRGELRVWRCDRITAISPAEAALFLPDAQLDAADRCAEPPTKAAR